MIAVTIALVPLESRDDHERAFGANDTNDVAEDVLAAPLHQRFLEALGKAVIDRGGEVLRVDPVILVGAAELLGANEAERVEQLGADRVVARLAASQREQRDARAVAATQLRQHTAVLVVGMR